MSSFTTELLRELQHLYKSTIEKKKGASKIFDFIIIGCGIFGLVAAAMLSEDSDI